MINVLLKMIHLTPYFKGMGKVYKLAAELMVKFKFNPLQLSKVNGYIFKLDIRSSTERYAFFSHQYDKREIDILLNILRSDKIIVDVGSNIGFYSVSLLMGAIKRGLAVKMLCFEPVKGNYHRLNENISNNNLQNICSTFNFGLSNRITSSQIVLRGDFLTGSATGNASIALNEDFDAGLERQTIHLDTLDHFVEKHYRQEINKIHLVKLDIEGHEDLFLEGAIKTLTVARPIIFMEVNKEYYRIRGGKLDNYFMDKIPINYKVLKVHSFNEQTFTEIQSFEQCEEVDDVFLVPVEKILNHESNYFVIKF